MAWKHRLTNINLKDNIADCSNCGPSVPLHNYDRPRCWYGRQKGGTYGNLVLTYEQKMILWNLEEDRACKICLAPLTYIEAVLDHCHLTNKLRNFLCNDCNLSIGKLGDTKESLQRAVDYLSNESEWLNGQQG